MACGALDLVPRIGRVCSMTLRSISLPVLLRILESDVIGAPFAFVRWFLHLLADCSYSAKSCAIVSEKLALSAFDVCGKVHGI